MVSVPEPRRPRDEECAASWCADAVAPREQLAEVLAEVHRWSAAALAAGDVVPVFGSPQWCALPEGAVKTYAAVRAALAWWTEQWARADAAAADHVDASHAVSAATNWRRVATDRLQRSSTRIPRAQ